MFQKLHEQAMAKMSLTFIIAALKDEKLQKLTILMSYTSFDIECHLMSDDAYDIKNMT